MGNLLSSLSKTIHASLALAIILFLGLFYQNDGFSFDRLFWSWVARYTHVVFGTYSSIYIANTVLVRLNVSQKTVLREDDKN